MTEPILDAMRYFTPFGYDVLSFVLVDRLASPGRDKLKADGLNISDWLQVIDSPFTHTHSCMPWPGVCELLGPRRGRKGVPGPGFRGVMEETGIGETC